MKILVACEESQRVCKELRELGHEAYSCDIQEPSGGHPEWHILGDVLEILNPKDRYGTAVQGISFFTMDGAFHTFSGKWDMIIAHPPCTYLSNAGAARLYPKKGQLNEERYRLGLKAKDFFMNFIKIAVENPIPTRIYGLPPYSQIIQPYEYGHPYSKKTCLWLKGLPKLQPTNIVEPKGMWVNGNSAIWKRQAANGEVIGKSKDPKERAKTFPGIAKAMAEQWAGQAL